MNIGGSVAVKRIEAFLQGDGAPVYGITVDQTVGMDGRYTTALGWKPVINGTFPLVVRAIDKQNRVGQTTCTPGVTVTF